MFCIKFISFFQTIYKPEGKDVNILNVCPQFSQF